MSQLPLQPTTPLQRLILEQALAFAQQLEAASQGAASGHVLEACETACLHQGRDFLRQALTLTLQQQADGAEKKARRPALAPVAARNATKGVLPARS